MNINDDIEDFESELDRLDGVIKELEAENARYKAYHEQLIKDWVDANQKYGPGVKCDHTTLRRPDQPCPECFKQPYLTMLTEPRHTGWYNAVSFPAPVRTETWVRDRLLVDGYPAMVCAWRKAE